MEWIKGIFNARFHIWKLRFLSRQYSWQMALKVKAKVQFSNLLVVTFPNPYAVKEIEEESFIEDIEEMLKKRT